MTQKQLAVRAVHDAERLNYEFPWPAIMLLTRAVVFGLLSIATAIDEHHVNRASNRV